MTEQLNGVITISELTASIRELLEENFKFVNLIAEISNFKIHTQSGHFYFTLKDESSQIQAVMWKTRNQSLLYTPEDGMKVIIRGRITVYPARGSYQIEVWELKPQGIGELQIRFEQLKQKLLDEGLFDESFKKTLPKYPENVVIITSKTGAALQDFINITNRRYPILNLFLFPVTVQGITAAESIFDALNEIENLIKRKILKIDIIVIARGGGSFEDLFPFNDEKLARRIFGCKIPVVSAVGHEVDFTICDFVSDLRAPTPSAAAELITPDINELIENLDKFSYFCRSFVQNKISKLSNSVNKVKNSYYFNRPKDLIYNFYQKLDDVSKSLDDVAKSKITFLYNQLKYIGKTLYHINPQTNLKKGYAILSKNQGDLFETKKNFIKRAKEMKRGEEVVIEMFDAKRSAKIN